MSTDQVNNASGAFGTCPASTYILNFLFIFVVVVASTMNNALVSAMKFVMFYLVFRINLNYNMPLVSTISAVILFNASMVL
jgi:hypothetical protein